jgi:VanZ family protein
MRKAAHVTEYSILAFLDWNALAKPFARRLATWPGEMAKLALLLSVLQAAADEYHQSFVPSRGSSVRDVAIDTGGALLALGAIWVAGRLRKAR